METTVFNQKPYFKVLLVSLHIYCQINYKNCPHCLQRTYTGQIICNFRFYNVFFQSLFIHKRNVFLPFERITNPSIQHDLCNQISIYTTKGFATDQDSGSKENFVTELNI